MKINIEPSSTIAEILIGSPRKKGNSSIMADMVKNELSKQKISSHISFLYDFEIKPCVDCRACKKDSMECILKDGMKDLYALIDNAEILIIATPIYWYGPSAQTKLLLDRFRPYYANKKLTGKKLALLLPAATGGADCDLTIEMFKRSTKALQLKYTDTVSAKAYDAGDVLNDDDVKNSIIGLVDQISISDAGT